MAERVLVLFLGPLLRVVAIGILPPAMMLVLRGFPKPEAVEQLSHAADYGEEQSPTAENGNSSEQQENWPSLFQDSPTHSQQADHNLLSSL